MHKIWKNFVRILWYLPYRILKYLNVGKILPLMQGEDILYPFAPYSEGSMIRKNFLRLYTKGIIATKQYEEKMSSTWDQQMNHSQVWNKKLTNQEYLRTWWIT